MDFVYFLPPGDGRNVFPSSSLSEIYLTTDKVSQRRKLFFFTDSPSGFPNSGSKHLRLGYVAETRDCHIDIKKYKVIWCGSPSDRSSGIPIGAFMPLARKTHEELPTPEKQFPPAMPSSW